MKCRIPTNTDIIRRHIEDEQQKACVRTQLFMFLAFHRALGIGPRRFGKVLAEYANVLAWYEEAKRDGAEEEKLLQAVRSIGLDVGEVFEHN